MKSDISLDIIKRFMKAFDYLKASKITNKTAFCSMYGIDRRNFYKVEKSDRTAIELSWIYYLCADFKVSAKWLITGDGSFFEMPFDEDSVKMLQIQRKNDK